MTVIKSMFGSLKTFSLPLLLAIYPPLFHYSNNATIILITSLVRMILLSVLFALGLYAIFFLIFRKAQPVQVANATSVFLIFFSVYGLFYKYLLELDLIRIEHFTLLPFIVLVALYASWLVTKITIARSQGLWKNTILVFSLLGTFNIIKIIPIEIQKLNTSSANTLDTQVVSWAEGENYPNIYYIVFDEFAGFESMREYWNYQDVDNFETFLTNNNFFIVKNSYSASESTIYELSTRLNYQYYQCCDDHRTYFEKIANNQATQYLKERGYTSVAFVEIKAALPADIPFQADYLYESDPSSPPVSAFLDEFGILVIDNTMASAFSNYYKTNVADPFLKNHRNMIYFTIEKVADLPEVPSPKFVFVHLLLPHVPFMFDATGNVIDQQYRNNWNYYLGNYIFTLQVAEKMVKNLLTQSDANNPPIIIIQSDHGARNQIIGENEATLLQSYPDEFKKNILFALHIPGYDFSTLPQSVKPINTFPIIFNYLFDAKIPLK